LVWFERAIQGSPTSSANWSEFAAIYMRQKNWDRAAELYLRETTDDPGSATAWLNYGLCEQQRKEFTESARGFGEAIKLKPEWASARYYQAVNYVMSDSTQAACRAYRQFIRLATPQAAEHRDQLRQAYRYLCVTYLVDRNWAAALEMLDPALRLDPNDVQLRLYRGQTLLGLNRKPEAKKEFETVLQMEPGNTDARKGLTVLAQYN
jgi:Tfp pilus assembly protein PilF